MKKHFLTKKQAYNAGIEDAALELSKQLPQIFSEMLEKYHLYSFKSDDEYYSFMAEACAVESIIKAYKDKEIYFTAKDLEEEIERSRMIIAYNMNKEIN